MDNKNNIKKDCRFYQNDATMYGCVALNRLYCRIEEKPCSFYKPKSEQKDKKEK